MATKTDIQDVDTINLQDEILRENSETLASEEKLLAEQSKLDREVDKVLHDADNAYHQEREGMLAMLGFDYKLAEAQKLKAERLKFCALPQNRIMSLGAIKNVCLKYGLRFLPTRFYKGALDSGIGPKVEEFRALLGDIPLIAEPEILQGSAPSNTNKAQFYIAAPSESFALTLAPKDPLLFCRLGLDKFFLVHKWGADLKKKDAAKHDITGDNWNSNVKKIADRDYYAQLGQFNELWAGQQQMINQFNPTWVTSSSGLTGAIGMSTAQNWVSLPQVYRSLSADIGNSPM